MSRQNNMQKPESEGYAFDKFFVDNMSELKTDFPLVSTRDMRNIGIKFWDGALDRAREIVETLSLT